MELDNRMVINGDWNATYDEPSAEEKAEIAAKEKRELEAAEFADGLRQVADFIEEHPEYPLPYGFLYSRVSSRENFVRAMLTLKDGAACVQIATDTADRIYPECRARRAFGPITAEVSVDLKHVAAPLPKPTYDLCPEVRAVVESPNAA